MYDTGHWDVGMICHNLSSQSMGLNRGKTMRCRGRCGEEGGDDDGNAGDERDGWH